MNKLKERSSELILALLDEAYHKGRDDVWQEVYLLKEAIRQKEQEKEELQKH